MRALTVADGQLILRDDYPVPPVESGGALLRILLAGICSTDLEVVRGYAGFGGVLGHEFVGVVEDVGADVDRQWIGRTVVGAINIGCGECDMCRSNGPEHCPNRQALGIHNRDGAFAELMTIPVGNLFEVPDGVSDEAAVFTEPLAAAVRIREQIIVRPGARTAVVGPGRLGLLIGQVLALAGTEVIMLGRRQASLVLPAELGLRTGLAEDFPDNSFDLVVEATGNSAGFAQTLRLVRPLGTIVLKSTFSGSSQIDLTRLVVSEITVVGSRCGPFAPALRLLEAGAVHVIPMIEAEYPLDEGVAAFEHAASPGVRKILLRP
jgi:threonine dehydrogenase-like Zn-dependent dehydrogenase